MKVSTPKGTRDFSPAEMGRRNFIFKTIREVFEQYGYQPIETPTMENLTTLEGKYGEEGDKLLFRILNSGMSPPTRQEGDSYLLKSSLKGSPTNPPSGGWGAFTEKGLRYDLTVPFARYVVQHQNDITFPFRRYQLQPVWRADKPQKSRYREFYQCDADVIGSNSLLNEAELVQMIDEVMSRLGISAAIKINNRKILQGIADFFKITKFTEFVTILDKADKTGWKLVKEELAAKDILHHPEIEIFSTLFWQSEQKDLKVAVDQNKLELLKVWNEKSESEAGKKGVEEIEAVFALVRNCKLKSASFELDLSLARGLDYYTGAIFEVKANGVQMGSICGGGRYDDLTGIFGLPGISGVGISFGVDRIYDVMSELNLFDAIGLTTAVTKVMLAHFGEEERNYCMDVAAQLRSAGINTEIYPDVTKKISKQFDYANKKQIPYVIVVGSDEMKTGELALKDMAAGEQVKMKIQPIIQKLQS